MQIDDLDDLQINLGSLVRYTDEIGRFRTLAEIIVLNLLEMLESPKKLLPDRYFKFFLNAREFFYNETHWSFLWENDMPGVPLWLLWPFSIAH